MNEMDYSLIEMNEMDSGLRKTNEMDYGLKKMNEMDYPLDTERKLNVHKTFRRRPGRLLSVLCTFSLRPVSRGYGLNEINDNVTKTEVI